MSRRSVLGVAAAALAGALALLALVPPRPLLSLLGFGDAAPRPPRAAPTAPAGRPSPSPPAAVGALPGRPPRNVRVTRDGQPGSYRRHDGVGDPTTASCSTGRREQNEPSVAVDPSRPSVVVIGANEYCTAMTTGDAWVSYHRSTDGGRTWRSSLVPGYPTDGSAAGAASPTHGTCGAASDPSVSFDREGRLFFGFICFDRRRGRFGGESFTRSSTFVAAYEDRGARYVGTTLVARGTPDRNEDKINLVVDRTGGHHDGNVYAAWVELAPPTAEGVPQDPMLFARSTDHGRTFSPPIPVSPLVHPRFPDMAVAPDGTIHVAFRSGDTFWVVRSVDGGRSFEPPVQLAPTVVPFDSQQFSGAGHDDCGVRRFRCPAGFVFPRFDSQVAVAADDDGVHAVWNERLGNGQSKIVSRHSPDGASWGPARPIDRVPVGHQWFPDLASDGGVLTVVFHDSRADPHYAPTVPPGNTGGGRNSGRVVHTLVARSTDGGRTWTERRVSRVGSNFGYLVPDDRPFWGDYITVSAVAGVVQVAWTDSRDVATGPRRSFGVRRECPRPVYADDPCLSQGGSDQNVYTARL